MKFKRLGLILPALLLSAASRRPGPLTLPTQPPVLLEGGYGHLELLPEKEFREAMQENLGEEGFVPLSSGSSGLSEQALFDVVLLLDRTVTLAVDGAAGGGHALIVDLNADGSLDDDPRWPMHKQSTTLWDFGGARGPKEAEVADVDTTISSPGGGELGAVPFRMAVALTEDRVRNPGHATPMLQALSNQSTLRQGAIALDGREIAFALRGEAGIYNDDFSCVLFDLNGDGRLDPEDRSSSEYFWVWEKTVDLAGAGYRFEVDRFGRSLTLTPLGKKAPRRASLEVGQLAPDFAFIDLDGKKRRLKDYRGKVVILDFWGIWCPACAVHAQDLSAAYRELRDQGLEILGIHGGGKEAEVRQFTALHSMPWPETLEAGSLPEGRPLQRLYRTFGAPNYFLIDRKGRIVLSDAHQPAVLLREAERLLSPEP
jgi:thiol-disulfide isomerase/thioredoxin